MALMLLHEWELRPEPEEDGPPRRDPIDWRAQRWALLAALLFLAGVVVGSGTLRLALMWLALVVVVRRGWRELDGVGGLSEHRQ